MIFETSKHVPKTEKRCCVFKDNRFICANKTIWDRIIFSQSQGLRYWQALQTVTIYNSHWNKIWKKGESVKQLNEFINFCKHDFTHFEFMYNRFLVKHSKVKTDNDPPFFKMLIG